MQKRCDDIKGSEASQALAAFGQIRPEKRSEDAHSFADSEAQGRQMSLPSYATRAIDMLEGAGYETWCVGGFVRDALLGRTCADIDLATSACWQDVQRVFETAGYRTHETGTAHGTLTVMIDKVPLEVTTYRTDGSYGDTRHPDSVAFVRTIEEDLGRRDFTINALAYHPARGLMDPYRGIDDLHAGIIRTVGDPSARFSEDALRMLRACRFASQLGFAIEDETFAALLAHKNLLACVSAERVTHELDGFVRGTFVHDALMQTADVLAAVLPELVAMKGFDQHSPYHIYDVLEHTAWTMQQAPATSLVRWAALLHDIGKPAAFFRGPDGVGHFYGHAAISAEVARGVLRRLRMPSAFCSRVLTLVARHDDVVEPTTKAVKRLLARLDGDVDLFSALCDLKRADSLAHAPEYATRAKTADALEDVLAQVMAEGAAFSRDKLAVNGRDVMAWGVPAGPAVGAVLAAALEAVIDEEVENDAQALFAFVMRWLDAHSGTDAVGADERQAD